MKQSTKQMALTLGMLSIFLLLTNFTLAGVYQQEYEAIYIQYNLDADNPVSTKLFMQKLSQRYPGVVYSQQKVGPGLIGNKNEKLYSFQQYLKGRLVQGGELRVKEKNGLVYAALGKAYLPKGDWGDNLAIDTGLDIPRLLRKAMKTNQFCVEVQQPIFRRDGNYLQAAWKLVISKEDGLIKAFEYNGENLIDLGTPAVCSQEGHEKEASCTYRPGCTEHHGNVANYFHQSVVKYEGGKYKLLDDCARNIKTVYWDGGTNYGEHSSNNWCNDTRRKRAYSAHWGVRFAWDFYRDIMGRNGQFGDGRRVDVKLNSCIPAITCNTAWSNPDDYSINIGSGGLQYNQVKTMGHEYTHGVLWSSNWDPGWTSLPTVMWTNSEVRSITEGICNIMGSEIENFLYDISASAPNSTIPTNIDQAYQYWYNFDGNGHTSTNYPRSLYYKGTNWNKNGSGWNGNTIYDRSFVLCHLFYLLAEGASNYKNPHHPSGSGAPTINLTKLNGSLSRVDAAKLMYVSIMSYLHSGWTYEEMAWAMLTTASEWWGICSSQADRVNKALWAVGLAKSATNIEINFTQGFFDRPITLRTPNSVEIDHLSSVSNVFIEAGKIIVNPSNIEPLYGATVILKSKTCLPGLGVPFYGPEVSTNKHVSWSESSILESSKIKIAPNPFSDQIYLYLPPGLVPDNEVHIRLVDIKGQVVYQSDFGIKTDQLELKDPRLNGLTPGIYFIEIRSEHHSSRHKVLKI